MVHHLYSPDHMSHLNSIVFMRNSFLKIGMALAICGVAAISGLAAGTEVVTLNGHLPAAISALKLQPKGELPATNQLTLAIGLPLHNTQAMSNLLARIYDPSTTDYHQYLTPDQFISMFGPSEQDYASVSNFAKANGLTIVGQHRSRMLLDVSGKVSDIENAFHVKMHTYQHPTENRSFFAPDSDPSVPASLPILHISGLDNYSVPKQMLHPEPLNGASGASPHTGSGPTGTYIGNDFRSAYVPGTTLTGTGQSVGLVEFDGFFPSDITAYENLIGLTGNAPRVVVVPVDGGIGSPGFSSDEVSLDIEMVLSMSPGVSAVYVYETPPDTSLWVDMLSRMADDDLSSQLSSSWGGGEQPNPSAELIFEQMALQGQSFFQASGDSCAYNNANNPIPFPSDSPHITLVGGTTLTMNGNAASYASETVWNWGTEFGIDGEGSSGGISSLYSIPSWQTNINMTLRGGSQTARNVPDVALTADNVWVIYGGGQSGSFGGTSCAAPLWAAFTALVNQQAVSSGKASVGFLNPTLYSIANGANYANDFHDVTAGNNEWSGSRNRFVAFANYDLCTGLGSPNGMNLINALASTAGSGLTHISPPPAPYGTTLSTLTGSNPNGDWDLFIVNDSAGDFGEITNGWSITLSLANPVGFAADNYLTMTATTNLVATNSYGTYALTVTNYGPSTSSNVVVADTLPTGVIVITTNASAGTVNRLGTALTWTLGNLTNTAGGQLTITIQPQTSGSFLNTATVSANTPTPTRMIILHLPTSIRLVGFPLLNCHRLSLEEAVVHLNSLSVHPPGRLTLFRVQPIWSPVRG